MIRNLLPSDASPVLEIYRQGLDTGEASFETEAPDWPTWNGKYLEPCRLVSVDGERVQGWAALAPVSARHCYRGVAEVCAASPRREAMAGRSPRYAAPSTRGACAAPGAADQACVVSVTLNPSSVASRRAAGGKAA